MALWLLRSSPEPQDVISCNMVLRACCKASQWPRSMQLLGQFQPDATSLSTVAAALEDWELAVALLHDARGQAIQPNIVVYGAAAGRARGHWPVATALLAAAAQEGIGISKIAQSAVMSSHEAAGRWESTLLMLEGARRAHLEPDVVEFSSGVSASSRSWPVALEVLLEAKACGIQLDAVANNAAITAAGRGSCWPLALETLEQASAQGARTVRSFRAALAAIGSGGWQGALRLLSSMRQRAVTPDLECFNEVLLACASAGAWEVCTSTLQVMRASRCPPDLRAFGCSARSCGLGQAWQQAVALVEDMREHRLHDPDGSVWNAVAWAHQAAGVPVPAVPGWVQGDLRKEHTLLDFVRRRAQVNDLFAVLRAIEDFAESRKWLKVAGGRKAALLKGSLRPGDRVVEFGTYMGYSAMLMASRLRELGGGGRVVSCDVNAQTWPFARELLAWAGVGSSEVELKIGIAGDWLASGQLGEIDVLLLDHRGTVYQEDLKAAEPHLSRQARVLADNVLLPGAPLFLGFIAGRYDVAVHEVPEFRLPELQDWILTCVPTATALAPAADVRELRQWGDKVDEICWASLQGDVDWEKFQEDLAPALRSWSMRHGLPGPRWRHFSEAQRFAAGRLA
ncbi:LRTOMT [Symbiodinium sp. CCMP2592]|nr:LRTOMT [Symbiodinium sp. CCMP2592]